MKAGPSDAGSPVVRRHADLPAVHPDPPDAAGVVQREEEIRASLESLRQEHGWDHDLLKAVVTTLIVADLPEEERRAFFAQLLDQAMAKLGEGDRVAAIGIADSEGGLSALRFIMNRRADAENPRTHLLG